MRILDSSSVDQFGVGICVVDLNDSAIFRNQSCRAFCQCPLKGAPETEPLELCAFHELRQKLRGEMMHTLRAFSLNNAYYDVVFVRHGDHEYFMLYPLEKRLETIRGELQGRHLTDRELEITSLLLLGLSNEELCERFGIRMNTLRTHLKSIYRKIPEATKRALGPEPQA